MDEEFQNNEKYSMSIYHFNLQYMAGNRNAYFKLVKASFQPFIKFFNQFPQWKANLELQGHMIAFLARHFPEDLALLRKLNQRNQIEIVSAHYSDQIFLAYPERDMEESVKINDEILNKYGLKRSGVFFAQENFFGEGVEKHMVAHNYNTALINQHFYSHHHEERKFAPYYKYKRINALIKGEHGYNAEDHSLKIQQRFSYWDDGELAFARGNNYIPGYGASEKAFQNHIIKYKKLEMQGFKMVGVEDYIHRVKELELKPVELGPITDGTWNMWYYGGVYLWMGTYRFPWERDGEIRSSTYRARGLLLATETLIEWCKLQGLSIPNRIYLDLKVAWKHLLLAEVSDSTGQTPVLVEIYYSRKETKDCEDYCNKIIRSLSDLAKKGNIENFPSGKYIDTSYLSKSSSENNTESNGGNVGSSANNNSLVLDSYPLYLGIEKNKNKNKFRVNSSFKRISMEELQQIVGGTISILRARPRSVHYTQYRTAIPPNIQKQDQKKDQDHIIFDIEWHPNYAWFTSRILSFFREKKYNTFTPLYDNKIGCYSGLIFPLNSDELIYCPALMDKEPRVYKLSEFDFKRTWIPLPNGLIGLGNDIYIIKHNNYGDTHIAATLNLDHQFISDENTISFMTLNPPRKTYHWRFSIFKGELKDAVKLANSININPIVKFPSKIIQNS